MITKSPHQTANRRAEETLRSLSDRRKDIIIERLLHELRKFAAVYPINMTDELPEHSVEWVTGISTKENPFLLILNTVKAFPDLWIEMLPKEVCVIPRRTLEKITDFGPDIIDNLNTVGLHMVIDNAERFRHSLETDDDRPF